MLHDLRYSQPIPRKPFLTWFFVGICPLRSSTSIPFYQVASQVKGHCGVCEPLSGQWMTAASERKLSFSETYFILVRCGWKVKLHPSNDLFNTLIRGLGFPDSISLWYDAHVIYNIVHYNAHTLQRYSKGITKLLLWAVTMVITQPPSLNAQNVFLRSPTETVASLAL